MYNRLSSVYFCLEGRDVITAKVSDHHPVVDQGTLFWNIMMQAKKHTKDGRIVRYNNGFSMEEDEKQYLRRLTQVAAVMSEIVAHHPLIETIGLCEGPISDVALNHFLSALKKQEVLQRFLKKDGFYNADSEGYAKWGLLMLTDKSNRATKVKLNFDKLSGLTNRFQLWRLTRNHRVQYLALAHFPFGGDELATNEVSLSANANEYRKLINRLLNYFSGSQFIICADFNFNPFLISRWDERRLDQIPINNSILSIKGTADDQASSIQAVTVDGILLSKFEKQKRQTLLPLNASLIDKLQYEHRLFKLSCKETSKEKLNQDKRFWMVRYKS